MASWLEQTTSNNELCDAIDEIMKQEHEDVISLDEALSSGTTSVLNIDSFPDLLDNSSTLSTTGIELSPLPSPSTTRTDYSQNRTTYDLPMNSCSSFNINTSPSNPATSPYSALGISPKFTALSIHQKQHPFSPPLPQDTNHSSSVFQKFAPTLQTPMKTNFHPPPFDHINDNRIRSNNYPFDSGISNGQSDVKRFRSASMNEGATEQQARLDSHLLDPYRMRSVTYVEPSYYYSRANSSTNTTITTASSSSSVSTDISSNTPWPYVGTSRPTSSSFSETLQHPQDQHLLQRVSQHSSSFSGSPSIYSSPHLPNQGGYLPDLHFPAQPMTNCTLFSLNQPTNPGATKTSPGSLTSTSFPLSRKRPSPVDFPTDEIKTDPTSPISAIELQNETDLWPNIERNSSDPLNDNDNEDDDDDEITSDDETATTVSTGFHADLNIGRNSQMSHNSSSPFWQYNVQAKGPKTKRILYLKERDPHLFREFSDPVYQIKLTQTRGQTLTKLRKGDGNDVTPNPVKLYQLGKQIRDLSTFVNKGTGNAASVYHGIYHADPQNNNNDTAEVKKEKNKIASRACRLRKKAQHEANKLKLHGLNEEHKTLIDLIASIKILIVKRCHGNQITSPSSSPNQTLEAAFDQLVASRYTQSVAGNTDGFVQGIINDMENLYATKQGRSNSLNT